MTKLINMDNSVNSTEPNQKRAKNEDMSNKLYKLATNGVGVSKYYTIDSNYDEMKKEYYIHTGMMIDFDEKDLLEKSKLDMLRKLIDLTYTGSILRQKINMYSDYQTMKDEYDFHTSTPKRHSLINRLTMLRKLGELKIKGIELSKIYDIDSDFNEMKSECDLHNSIIKKHKVKNFMSKLMESLAGVIDFNTVFDTLDEDPELFNVVQEIYEKYMRD